MRKNLEKKKIRNRFKFNILIYCFPELLLLLNHDEEDDDEDDLDPPPLFFPACRPTINARRTVIVSLISVCKLGTCLKKMNHDIRNIQVFWEPSSNIRTASAVV